MITRANRKTADLNTLLKYIEYIVTKKPSSSKTEQLVRPEDIIGQYDSSVKIGEFREHLMMAFRALDQYQNLVQSAYRISKDQCLKAFVSRAELNGKGYVQGIPNGEIGEELRCHICDKNLVEYD